MNSPTFSPNLFLTLFVDMQGGFSFSIPISTVPAHPNFQENVGRLWTNAQFQFFLDICEKKFWECNQKPFKEANWMDLI